MSGSFIFRPLQANLIHNTEILGKMDPYCVFKVGIQKFKSQVCKRGGKHPTWSDSVIVPMSDQPTCLVEIKDRDLIKDDLIGSFEVDLDEIQSQGTEKKWYSIYHQEKLAGQILMEVVFVNRKSSATYGSVVEASLSTQSTCSSFSSPTHQHVSIPSSPYISQIAPKAKPTPVKAFSAGISTSSQLSTEESVSEAETPGILKPPRLPSQQAIARKRGSSVGLATEKSSLLKEQSKFSIKTQETPLMPGRAFRA